MFLLKCPKCNNTQNYQSSTITLTGKRKKCVYCGNSFKVHENILKKI